jgi:hypothetical protein
LVHPFEIGIVIYDAYKPGNWADIQVIDFVHLVPDNQGRNSHLAKKLRV